MKVVKYNIVDGFMRKGTDYEQMGKLKMKMAIIATIKCVLLLDINNSLYLRLVHEENHYRVHQSYIFATIRYFYQ